MEPQVERSEGGNAARAVEAGAGPAVQTEADQDINTSEMPAVDRSVSAQIPEAPDLSFLTKGRALTSRLDPQQRAQATAIAKGNLAKMDSVAAVDNMTAEWENGISALTQRSGQIIRENVRMNQMGELRDLLDEYGSILRKNGVKSLEENWFSRTVKGIPIVGVQYDKIERFFKGQAKLETRLEEIFRAVSEKARETKLTAEKAKVFQDVLKDALKNFTLIAASLEIMLGDLEKSYRKETDRLRALPSLDEEDTEQVKSMVMVIHAMKLKLVSFKSLRNFAALGVSRAGDLRDGLTLASMTLTSDMREQRFLWNAAINEYLIAQTLKGANDVIKVGRANTKRLVDIAQNASEMGMNEIAKLIAEGSMPVEVIKKMAERTKAMHDNLNKAYVTASAKLDGASATLDEMDKVRNDGGTDLATLEAILNRSESMIEEAKKGGGGKGLADLGI